VRTSLTHPLYVSWFSLEGDDGKLGITLCPGKYQPVASTGSWDRQLDVDLQALADSGVTRLISLITDEDMEVLRVRDLPDEVARLGFAWDHLPLPDTTAPTEAWMERARPVFDHLLDAVPGGEVAVAHCMGGLSRAGTFVCIYLWLRGASMRDAIQRVREERSPNAINARQVEFLLLLEADVRNGDV
jgi:ADP-ribosyl-[dinitrogen reductase] hydrolase